MRAMPALAAALLTASLALAGCSSSTERSSASDSAAKSAQDRQEGLTGTGAAADSAPSAAPGGKGEKAETSAPAGTHVIRTAQLTVRVKNAQKALATARDAAEKAGGLVQNESTERVEDDHVMSSVVLRVPQDSYDSVLAELAGTGTLITRQSEAKDVTDQVVDVNSRVASQRVSVDRVRKLMDRATDLSDVVALEGELSTRQSALESLLAQQASLKDRTTLATITLELTETPPSEEEKEDEGPGFLDALGGGWDAFTATLRWITVVLGAVVPFAASLAVLYLLWRLIRGRLHRRAAPAATPVTADEGGTAVEGAAGRD